MVAVAHASLAGYLTFRDTPEVAQWLSGAFFKVVCQVNAKAFENAKSAPDHVVITEAALGNREIALAFKPREDWPRMFKFMRLYREAPSL